MHELFLGSLAAYTLSGHHSSIIGTEVRTEGIQVDEITRETHREEKRLWEQIPNNRDGDTLPGLGWADRKQHKGKLHCGGNLGAES